MIDMLVRLYDLPDSSALYAEIASKGIILRRARAFEKHTVEAFVRSNFSDKWASEVEVAMTRQPSACFLATQNREIIGFACYDTTQRGFFGPTGVCEKARGLGLGKALLFKSLEALRELGHAYAIIGGVGPRSSTPRSAVPSKSPAAIRGSIRTCFPNTIFLRPLRNRNLFPRVTA